MYEPQTAGLLKMGVHVLTPYIISIGCDRTSKHTAVWQNGRINNSMYMRQRESAGMDLTCNDYLNVSTT